MWSFACMFDDYLWKSYVYRTTFSNVKYQDVFVLASHKPCCVLSKTTVIHLNLQCTLLVIGVLDLLYVTPVPVKSYLNHSLCSICLAALLDTVQNFTFCRYPVLGGIRGPLTCSTLPSFSIHVRDGMVFHKRDH